MTAPPSPAGRLEGRRRKLSAHALLEAHREFYIRRMARALVQALLDRGRATADDMRRAVELPARIDPRCCGAVTGPLARAGIMRRVGYLPSARREAHARPLSVWELIDAAAARYWLLTHPDLPDPPEPESPEQPTLFDSLGN